MTKSIAEAVRNVADYVEHQMGSGVTGIVPGIHEVADRRREAVWSALQKTHADALRKFAARSETEPVTLAEFASLVHGHPVPNTVRLPAEWAIYDCYGA